jgi:hypothetical protein
MKTTIRFILLISLGLFYLPSQAQILNIDRSDTSDYSSKAKFDMHLSAGLEIDKQQTTLYDATNKVEMMLQKKKELLICAASYRFTDNGDDDILNTGYFHLRFRHHYKDKFQPEAFLQYQWDSERGLIYRYLGGANVRYNFWKGARWEINAGMGLMYEAEEWDYAAVDSAKLPVNTAPVTNKLIKFNSYVRLDWKMSDNSDIAFNVFLQTPFTGFHPRVAPGVQWNVAFSKHFSFAIAFSGIYDQQPVVPIDKFYYSLSNSILFRL